jgi:PAS domain S-box-containing protein
LDYTRFETIFYISSRGINGMEDTFQQPNLKQVNAQEAFSKAEKEAASAKIAKDILEYILDPVIMVDLEGKIVQFNRAFTRRFGYTDEIIGQSPAALVIESEKTKVSEVIRDVKEKGFAVNVEHTCLTKYHRQFPILLSVSLLRNPDAIPLGIVGVIRDITLRKKAEEQLKRSEERFHSTLDNMMEGCQIIGFDWRYLYINYAAAEHGRHAKPDYIGRTITELFPEIETTEMFTRLQQCMLNRTSSRIENKFVYPNGEQAWFELSMQPIPEGLFVLSLDITERKQAEEALDRKNEELARSNTELQQFAYTASHDLQEPLRMVSSYVQLLQRRYKGKLDQDADDFINYAVDGAARMRTMIDDLLQFSRVESRSKPFKRIEIEKILDNALNNLQINLAESEGTITRDRLPEIMGDEGQLTQVFQNLISNALKFRGEREPRIHISAQKRGKEWVFSVQDNGIGIEPQYFDRIFIIFKRLHNRQEYKGSGIGLAVCKKIVERHGGKIWLESEYDKGSTFYFSIPAGSEKKQ